MQAKQTDSRTRRVAVILGPGGSSRSLLDAVLPLLGKGRAMEMHGVFLEESELRHAVALPFVKELCRVTFDVREINSDQFEQVLALRLRTARKALSVLARRAGVTHSFENVRGSAVHLLTEISSQSDITIFEPVRSMALAMSPGAQQRRLSHRIVVAINDLEQGGRALLAASQLSDGEMHRVSVLLTPSAAADTEALSRLFSKLLPGHPGYVRTVPAYDVESLAGSARAENAAMLVLTATPEIMSPDFLRLLRQRIRCPICLVTPVKVAAS